MRSKPSTPTVHARCLAIIEVLETDPRVLKTWLDLGQQLARGVYACALIDPDDEMLVSTTGRKIPRRI